MVVITAFVVSKILLLVLVPINPEVWFIELLKSIKNLNLVSEYVIPRIFVVDSEGVLFLIFPSP